MAQLAQLGNDGLLPDIVTDAEDVDGNTGTEVDIFFAIYIVQYRALAMIEHGIQPVIDIDNIFFIHLFKFVMHRTCPFPCSLHFRLLQT